MLMHAKRKPIMFVHLRADLRYKIHESGAWSSYMILIYQVQKVQSRELIDQLCYVLGIGKC
jgi:hypothetical protein